MNMFYTFMNIKYFEFKEYINLIINNDQIILSL